MHRIFFHNCDHAFLTLAHIDAKVLMCVCLVCYKTRCRPVVSKVHIVPKKSVLTISAVIIFQTFKYYSF